MKLVELVERMVAWGCRRAAGGWALFCSVAGYFAKAGYVVTKWSAIELFRAVMTYALFMKVLKAYPPPCAPV
jgi:hypothetical protein